MAVTPEKDKEALYKLMDLSDRIPFFKSLNRAEINELLTEVKFITYKNKDIIFHEGESQRN